MLSFPFNSSSMVMWINLDALKKADIATPPKTWPEVFAAAKKLHATSPTCGFSSAWGSWGLIEQFSAWHNVPMGSKANGLDGFDTVLAFNTPLETKLLENIAELQKDKSYDYSGRTNTGEGRFTSGECPMFMTSSAFYPNVKANAKFSYTDRQANLHQVSGYLPITKAAYEKTKADGFYEKNPILEVPLKELTNKPPTENSRGLRFGGMVQLRDVFAEEIEAALAGKKSAKEALDTAVSRGNAMLRQFERTAVK
jgi:sn-glycerol 3-phosphate transport system substrate-binding protein